MDSNNPLPVGETASTSQPHSHNKKIVAIQNAVRNRLAKLAVAERREKSLLATGGQDDSEVAKARKRLTEFQEYAIPNSDIRNSRRTELLLKGKKSYYYSSAGDGLMKRNLQVELRTSHAIAAELDQAYRLQQSTKSQQRREFRTHLDEMRARVVKLQPSAETHEGNQESHAGSLNGTTISLSSPRKAEPFRMAADKNYEYLLNHAGMSEVRRAERKRKVPQPIRRVVGHRHRGARGGFADREDYQRGDAPLLTMLQSSLANKEFDGPVVQPRIRDEVLKKLSSQEALQRDSTSAAGINMHSLNFDGDETGQESGDAEQQVNRTFEAIINATSDRVCGVTTANPRFFPSPHKVYVEPLRTGASSVPLFESGRSPRKGVPDVCRTTQSMRAKKKILMMTFFDEYGAINGEKERIDALPPLRPGHGFVSPTKKRDVDEKAKQESMLQVREYQRRTAGLGSGLRSEIKAPIGASGGTNYPPGPRHDALKGMTRLAPIGEVSTLRVKELTAGVFVTGGNIGSYMRKMERETKNGLLFADNRRSMQDRLGGSSRRVK